MRPGSLALACALACALVPMSAAFAAPAAKQVAKVVAPQRTPHDRFGTSLAADRGRALVGSVLADVGVFANAGRTHALVHENSEWTVAMDLESAVGASVQRQLGYSAAVYGTFAVFGAINDNSSGLPVGSLYAYNFAQAMGWSIELVLGAPAPVEDKDFGVAVAVTNKHVLASRNLPKAVPVGGRTYAWTRESPGQWTPLPAIEPDDTSPADGFGLALALFEDRALIGAPGVDAGRGAAYMFTWTGTAWTQSAKFVAADRQPDDRFGAAIALGPGLALVGAPGRAGGIGSVFTFQEQNLEWVPDAAPLVPEVPELESSFGHALALDGSYALVTAPDQGTDPNDPKVGGRGQGSWYGRRDGAWILLARVEAAEGIPGDRLGFSLAIDQGDALLGAPGDDGDLGAVYVFRLALAPGAVCIGDSECEAGLCCEGVCSLPDTCTSTTGEPTGTTDPSVTTATSADLPPLDIDPLHETGCMCTTRGSRWPSAWLLLVVLVHRRRRYRST